MFPMINVGLVYCQRCAKDGSAHRVLAEVSRRVQQFLFGPLLYKTKHRHTFIAERASSCGALDPTTYLLRSSCLASPSSSLLPLLP